MQAAVDIVQNSPHPTNKVAATVFGNGADGTEFSISRTNHWPEAIENALGHDTRIGNASGTIHAETACILNAPRTDAASLCVTDPFCPNCAKNIAEAGIRTIYIDHKGFKKDFFARRSDHFEDMSMQICEKAGISVYELWRKDEKLVPIYMAPDNYTPPNDSPIASDEIENANEKTFKKVIEGASALHHRRKFTLAFVKTIDDKNLCLIARSHVVRGFTMQDPDDAEQVEHPQGKYSFIQEPVNRILMHISRHGYRLIDDYFYCSQIPTAREQVNLVGAGVKRITIGDLTKSRDASGLEAMELLSNKKIISYV